MTCSQTAIDCRRLRVPGFLPLSEWPLLFYRLQEKLATHSHSCGRAQIDVAKNPYAPVRKFEWGKIRTPINQNQDTHKSQQLTQKLWNRLYETAAMAKQAADMASARKSIPGRAIERRMPTVSKIRPNSEYMNTGKGIGGLDPIPTPCFSWFLTRYGSRDSSAQAEPQAIPCPVSSQQSGHSALPQFLQTATAYCSLCR